MNAIEIKNLSKSFRSMYAVDHLNMTVPVGAIYGFIGENGSGKSTTEKLICGHLVPDSGSIKLFGKDYTDPGVCVRVGALIENAGCFPNSSVYQNLRMQTINLGLEAPDEEISRVLKIVRMEDSANIKFKSCSLGMKQRIGIAMALLGDPALLILDEPINGLDNSPVYSASKAISLASASVSVLTLESTMLTTFNDGTMDLTTRRIMLGASGGVISAFIIAMAIYMIVQGSKKIKLLGAAKG